MTHFRLHHELKGNRIHVHFYAGQRAEVMHTSIGKLIMTPREWEDFQYQLTAQHREARMEILDDNF